ncbi:MAG: hypothetical protein ABI528_07895 [bacterium]
MSLKFFLVVMVTVISYSASFAQQISLQNGVKKKFKYNVLSDKIFEDTGKDVSGKSKVQKVNTGGLFISPSIGVSFPAGTFANYSNAGVVFGGKAELAYSRLYPFIFAFIYETQKNKGNDEFTTTNFLTKFDTKITWIGGGLDIILNKYIRSDFTIPVFSAEVKYAKVTHEITPEVSLPGITLDESLLTYSAGLAFTIYIIDINTRYTFAKDYSNLTFQARFHFPLIRF